MNLQKRALTGLVLACAFMLLGTGRVMAGSVTGITVGSQTGTPTYGTAASATFTISFTSAGSGSYSGLAASGLPLGATYSLSATSGSGNPPPNVTLTITTATNTPAGSFTITVSSTSPSLSNTGTLTVGKKSVTITSVTAADKVYDGTATATLSGGTVSGVANGDNVTVVAGTGVFASRNVGTQAVTASGYTIGGTDAGNYSLSAQPTVPNATINTKSLTALGTLSVPSSKIYDGTTSASVSGAAALQGTETAGTGSTSDGKPYSVDSVSLTGTASYAYNSKDVASATAVNESGLSLTGSGNGNYTLTGPSLSATITPKALTAQGTLSVPSSRVYDGTTSAAVAGAAALQSTETAGTGSTSDGKPYSVDSVSLTGTASYAYNSKDVASATAVNESGLSLTGTGNANYTLTAPSLSATITRKALTALGTLSVPSSKAYDATTVASVSGAAALQATEAAGAGTTSDGKPYSVDSVSLTGTASYAYNSKDVATATAVNESGLSLTGTGNGNYTLTAPSLAATITPKSLFVSGLTAAGKTYDATTTATLSGTAALLAAEAAGSGTTADGKPYTGDTVSLNSTAASAFTGTFASKDAANGIVVKITGNSLTGAQAGDYALSSTDEGNGTVTANIAPKALTMSGLSVAASKVYDATTTASVSGSPTLQSTESAGSGTISDGKPYTGDTVSITGTATGTYNSKDVATASSVSFSGLSLTGAQSSDYSLTIQSAASATITAKALTMSGLSVPASKVYDATTTATVSGSPGSLQSAESPGSGTASDGKPYSGDTLSITGTATGTYNSKDVATASSVSFSGISLTGAQAGDYTLTQQSAASATITPKALTMSGLSVPASKIYNATTTASVSGTPALQLAESAGSGTTSDGKPYSGDTVSITGTAAGTYNSKDVATASSVSFSSLNLTGAQSGDYSLTIQSAASATITAKALTMSGLSVPASKIYNATTTAIVSGSPGSLQSAESPGSGTTSDGKPYTGDTVSTTGTATGTYNSKDVATASSVSFSGISLTGAQASDYALTQQSAASATITPKALTMSGLSVPASKIYDATTTATVSGTPALQSAESVGSGTTSDGKPYTGDTVSITGTATGAYNSKDVTTASSVNFGGLSLTGAQSGDYSLTTQTAASATIAAKSLTVSGLIASNKVYDATTTAIVGGTAVLQSAEAPGTGTTNDGKPFTGDSVSVGGAPAGTFASANVATGIAVTVTGSTLSGAQATDYSVVQQTGLTADITKASTLSTVISSSNPSLPAVNVSFTNVLSAIAPGGGTPTGTVQFLTNGVAVGSTVSLSGGAAFFTTALLPHGSNSITAQYAGDSNFLGATNSLNPEQVINRPPVPGTNTVGTAENKAAGVSLVKFLSKASDPDGDATFIQSVNGTSAQGGSVLLTGTNVIYTPPANYAGADNFAYTLSDSFGGTSNATVYVTVRGPDVSIVISNITHLSDGNYQIKSSGIPGNSYLLQASSDLSSWSAILTNSADIYGVITFTDLTATNYSNRYYRTAVP
ncbi:MAG: hypothetical protein C5B50_19475 [Verrucomicrobia bacterium]|nr:MAG: hypothetical protein C5B50_19475 [Verrucomicrobiota bacterium]